MVKINTETYFDQCAEEDDWTREDSRELYVFLSGKLGKRVVNWLLLEARKMQMGVGMANLSTEEGVRFASQLQGQFQGVRIAVDTLIELADDEEEEEDETNLDE